MATAVLMMFYPAISRKIHRKKLMSIMMVMSTVGYVLMLVSGFLMNGSSLRFGVLTLGYMLSNFGQYGFYLVMMISIITLRRSSGSEECARSICACVPF